MKTVQENAGIENPNAWLSVVRRLGALMDKVYAHTSGEIWLFDNDLKVLEDDASLTKNSFEVLYRQRIDGSLSSRIHSIKILLRRNEYRRFCQTPSSALLTNICSLREDRIRTFYVGCLDDMKPRPPRELGGEIPWIFYLGERHLLSQEGIVIVRPKGFPFAYKDDEEDVAIAWRTSDAEIATLHARVTRQWFEDVFVTNCQKNFRSLEPKKDGAGRVVRYDLTACRSKEVVLSLGENLPDRREKSVTAPVDCAIITTLSEEFQAVVANFKLREHAGISLATGWYESKDGPISIVAVKCPASGSAASAYVTTNVIHHWEPRSVFLVGRCGGWREEGNGAKNGLGLKDEDDLQEGDVVVASSICAYEYQTLKKEPLEPEYDPRDRDVSSHLREAAERILTNWKYTGKLPDDWGDKRRPKAIVGTFACGCKIVRAGPDWFKKMKTVLARRKIVAVEMEGEGVAEVIRHARPQKEFLMLKGISDWANPDKTDKYKEFASDTAAHFLLFLLSQRGIKKRIRDG